MTGADKMDQIISVQASAHKGVMKYHKNIFLILLDIASLNCHVIYKANGGQKCFLDFKPQLVEEIISEYADDMYHLRKPSTVIPLVSRLIGPKL